MFTAKWVFKSDNYSFVLRFMSRVWVLMKCGNKSKSLMKYCCTDVVRP